MDLPIEVFHYPDELLDQGRRREIEGLGARIVEVGAAHMTWGHAADLGDRYMGCRRTLGPGRCVLHRLMAFRADLGYRHRTSRFIAKITCDD